MKTLLAILCCIVCVLSSKHIAAQNTDGTLSIDTLPKETFVIIADIYEKDPHYKKRKDFIGDTIYLLSEAIIDAKNWYAGSFNLDGEYEDYFYFKFFPVPGQVYEVAPPIATPLKSDFIQGPATFDSIAIGKFMNELYSAYRDSFEVVTGDYVSFIYGYKTTLNFPGSVDCSLSAIDPSLGFYADFGNYANEQEGYAAYTALLAALGSVKIYPDIYSDAYYFTAMGSPKPFKSGEASYFNVGFLMKDIGAIINVPGDDSVILDVQLMSNYYNGYYLQFAFYNKILAGF